MGNPYGDTALKPRVTRKPRTEGTKEEDANVRLWGNTEVGTTG